MNAQEDEMDDAAIQFNSFSVSAVLSITITIVVINSKRRESYQASELISASNMPMFVIAAAPIIQ